MCEELLLPFYLFEVMRGMSVVCFVHVPLVMISMSVTVFYCYWPLRLVVCLFVRLSGCLFICSFVCLFVRSLVCLFV